MTIHLTLLQWNNSLLLVCFFVFCFCLVFSYLFWEFFNWEEKSILIFAQILFSQVLLGNLHIGDVDYWARREIAEKLIKIIGWIFLKSFSAVDITGQFIWCKHSLQWYLYYKVWFRLITQRLSDSSTFILEISKAIRSRV